MRELYTVRLEEAPAGDSSETIHVSIRILLTGNSPSFLIFHRLLKQDPRTDKIADQK